jgi:Tol biopolymer transport system component
LAFGLCFAGALSVGGVAGLAGAASAKATTTTLVSVSMSGGAANGASQVVAITPDARFVLFNSGATNLVRGDTNGQQDVFVRNLQSGRTLRVNLGPHGHQANAASFGTAISPDGRFVVFSSLASDLLRNPDTNHVQDVFVRDRRAARTFRISLRSSGAQFVTPSGFGQISDDGRYVGFSTAVQPRVSHTSVRDRVLSTTHTVGAHESSVPAAMSADGRYVALYKLDRFGVPLELDLRDRFASRTMRVPSPRHPVLGAMAMTPDARYIAFSAVGPTLREWDVFRWQQGSSSLSTVSLSGSHRGQAVGISADGRFVAFISGVPSLVSGDTNRRPDMFRTDLTASSTIRVSLSATGAQLANGSSALVPAVPSLSSGDGSAVAFDTTTRAAPPDTNNRMDVYIRSGL